MVGEMLTFDGTTSEQELVETFDAAIAARKRLRCVLVTFVDPDEVRHKRDPGRCFLKAGFHRVGETKGGLLAFQLLPHEMPPAEAPLDATLDLFEGTCT